MITTIICDEATRLCNIKNKQYKALLRLNSQFRIAATGTPVKNRPDDLFGILNWIKPGCMGSWWVFMNTYTIRNTQNWIVGYRNLAKLAEELKPHMLRRTKEEVLELPPLIISDVPFELGIKERKLYDQIKKSLLFDIEKLEVNKIVNITSLDLTIVKFGKLCELCDSMELLGEGTDSTKLTVLKDLLSTLAGSRVIIFTRFSRMAKIIERELGCLKIIGEMSAQQRADEIDLFNQRDGSIMVGTRALSYGLNLQAANVIINFDSALSLAENEQRLGRIERFGQTNKMLCYNLIATKTVDQVIAKKLNAKQDMSRLLLSDLKELLAEPF